MPKRFRLGHFRRFRLLLASMLALLAGPFMPGFLNAADVLVVCPPEFRPALAPWLTHREGQGHQIELLSNRGTSADIQARIRQSASQQPVKFVLLVGDAGPAASESGAPRSQATAAGHIEAKVNVLFGSEPHICTDNGYADLDDDGVPDLAVGRLTADSPAELETIVQKILHYETQTGYGAWRQKIHFVGGLGGFGPLIDAAMEQWARRLITEGVPAAYATSMTYGSWQSPYCPAPPRFQQTTLDRLNEGGLFWIYMGHGSIRHVDAMRVPTAAYPILRAEDMPRLANRGGPPIALFLSCYSGAFDARQDCLAEELLRTDGGPVAVVCGSRVTMPYAMTVFGNELMQECFQAQRATLGELLLHAKRNTMLKGRDDDFSRGMDAAATAMNPQSDDLAAERAEHLALFNLLGDPLLRIAQPGQVLLQTVTTATAGERLEISGTSSVDGRCTCELVVRRDRLTFRPPPRDAYLEDAASLADYEQVYRQANDPRLNSKQTEAVDGVFTLSLDVPIDAHGPCHLRVFVEGHDSFAIGSADVKIKRAPRASIKAAQTGTADRHE